MKIYENQNLSEFFKYAALEAEKYSKEIFDLIRYHIINNFNNNIEFRDLTRSYSISYIIKIFSLLFINGIDFANFIGKQFPDSENNIKELFEESIIGLRAMTGFKEDDKENYKNTNIKRIKNVTQGQS